jgi:GTPase SAR1 family protein
MWRTSPSAALLVERMCRPQRVGVFGHRGVGKTTLLTMLYREAVGGRLPGLRLAAADARTAEYLSEKILQLETGRALPGTLAETDLRFQLYHHGRIELLVRDYQGEHVALGRDEPIREFLRDCDVVWICLDAGEMTQTADCLRRQQEVEQLVEDYLATEPNRGLHRPMALVLTKADLLDPESVVRGPESGADLKWLERLGMTRHAASRSAPWERRRVMAPLLFRRSILANRWPGWRLFCKSRTSPAWIGSGRRRRGRGACSLAPSPASLVVTPMRRRPRSIADG